MIATWEELTFNQYSQSLPAAERQSWIVTITTIASDHTAVKDVIVMWPIKWINNNVKTVVSCCVPGNVSQCWIANGWTGELSSLSLQYFTSDCVQGQGTVAGRLFTDKSDADLRMICKWKDE